MKLILATTILTLSFIQLNAQKRSVDAISLQTTGHFIDNTLRVVTSPQITLKKNNHVWSAGPAILVATEIATSDKNLPKLVGLQATYKTYPLQTSKKINFYFFDDLLMQRVVDKWTSNIWVEEQEAYASYRYENAECIFQNHVGYGLDLVLGKHILIQQAIGVGLYYSYTDGDELTPGAPEIESEDENINGYADFGFSWQIKVGLGFKL